MTIVRLRPIRLTPKFFKGKYYHALVAHACLQYSCCMGGSGKFLIDDLYYYETITNSPTAAQRALGLAGSLGLRRLVTQVPVTCKAAIRPMWLPAMSIKITEA
jgi:hypothetical protein